MSVLLEAKNISLVYEDGKNNSKAVKNLSLCLPDVGFFGILGPSGSGKTSLLYLLAGILEPSSGEIWYKGLRQPKNKAKRQILRRKEMGFVFQFHFLINYLTVFQNILVGADKNDVFRFEIVNMLINRLELESLKNKFPWELSGGQRQRVAIARSLANRPKVLFVDEPTASLDHKIGQKVIEMLNEFSQESCVVVVTHDPTNLNKASQIFQLWDGGLVDNVDSKSVQENNLSEINLGKTKQKDDSKLLKDQLKNEKEIKKVVINSN